MATYKLQITGMTCASCSARIEKVLNRLEAVESATVNLAIEQAHVVVTDPSITEDTLIEKITKAGFGATRVDDTQIPDDNQTDQSALYLLLFCLLLTLPLVAPMAGMLLGQDWHLNGWVQLLLATPVQIVAIYRFYGSAWGAVKEFTGNMDLLVALGTTAAYGLSLYLLFSDPSSHTELYFEASAAVTTLILLGKWLETRAKHGVTQAIRALMHLRPQTARRQTETGDESVPIAEVRHGDIIIVKPGEHIATDGEIIKGRSEIDESMLTGESIPIEKQIGDRVTGGSLNGSGLLEIRTTAVGKETVLAQIIEMIQGAQATKAPVQKLADKIASIFVPIVCVIALITLIAWLFYGIPVNDAIINAVTVLVVACPCALGLATPTAIMAGTGVGARHGILIKDAQALELAHKLDTVVFDKTGTLTVGKPELIKQSGDFLQIAASLQQGSEHPLAQAFSYTPLLPVEHFKAHPGYGIEGSVDGVQYRLGNRKHMNHDTSAFEESASAWEEEGYSVVWLENEHQIQGIFALGDSLKITSKKAINILKEKGIIPILLSGDNKRTAHNIAQQIGIETVIAEVLPAEKAAHVAQLKEQGKVLAMVGDGVNDAPALASADVSFAMASGSDVAIHSAAITLMRSDLLMVPQAVALSKATYRKIQQNLFWAFIYNVIALPAAAFGLLNPVIAGGAMALSSVSVVSNSLLLKRWKP